MYQPSFLRILYSSEYFVISEIIFGTTKITKLIQKGKDLNQFRSFSITAEQEFRKWAKLRVGDLIEVEGYKIRIE